MGYQKIDVRTVTRADADTVYRLLLDGSTWPTWGPMDSYELERAGDGEPAGLGEIRIFRTRKCGRTYESHERVIEVAPDRRLSYGIAKGLALRDYRADIDLTPQADGTEIHWHTRFRAKVPGTGWLYRRTLDAFTRRAANGLAAHAAEARQR